MYPYKEVDTFYLLQYIIVYTQNIKWIYKEEFIVVRMYQTGENSKCLKEQDRLF